MANTKTSNRKGTLKKTNAEERLIVKAVEWLDKNTAFYATFDENEDSTYEETKQNFLKNFADAMKM